MVAQGVDKFADEHEGRGKVFKPNIDENPPIPSKYGIRSIPTALLFNKGVKIDRIA